MPQENVEIVRQAFVVFNDFMQRGDREEIRRLGEDLVDPAIEFHFPHGSQIVPDVPPRIRGMDELLGFLQGMRAAWADLTLEPVELIEAPDEQVIVAIRQSGTGRQSGIPLVAHYFHLDSVRNGRVCKVELFRHRAEALEAAGLSE